MAVCDQLVESEQVHHSHQVHHGEDAIGLEVNQERDFMFSVNFEDAYFQITIHPDSFPYLWFVLQGKVYQFRALCFSLCNLTFPEYLISNYPLPAE